MEFDIVINNPKPQFFPGDLVEGKVVLNAQTNVDAGGIRIDFIGKSKSCLGHDSRTIYRSSAILFQSASALFTGNCTFYAGTRLEWPFSFTFPRTPQRPIENKKFEKEGCWLYDSEWPLPPSMAFEDVSIRGTLKCDIQYKLRAELTSPDFTFRTRRFCRKKELSFSPVRDSKCLSSSLATESMVWDVQSLRVLSEYQCRSLSMKEKMHSIFSWDVPVSSFQVTTSLPNRVVRGEKIPVFVQVQHRPAQSTAGATPEIHLREFSVSITTRTYGRAKGEIFWNDAEAKKKQYIFQSKLLNVPLHDQGDQGSDSVPIDFGDRFDIKCNVPLDFQSYNVRRRHTLELKVVLQCADKRHELQHKLPGFRVFSPVYLESPSPASIASTNLRCKFPVIFPLRILSFFERALTFPIHPASCSSSSVVMNDLESALHDPPPRYEP